jgi:hypothetical protein
VSNLDTRRDASEKGHADMRFLGITLGRWLPLVPLLTTGVGLDAATVDRARIGTLPARIEAAPQPMVSATGLLRGDRLLVPALTNLAPETFDVRIREGAALVTVTDAMTTFQGRTHLSVPTNAVATNAVLFVTPKSAVTDRFRLSTNRMFLPGQVILPLPESQRRPGEEVVSGQLYIEAERFMGWQPDEHAYATTLWVGLASTNSPALARRLLPLTVRFASDILKWDTNEVVVSSPGTGGEQPLNIRADRYRPAASLTARSDLGQHTIDIPFDRLGLLGWVRLLFPIPVLFAVLAGGVAGGLLRSFHPARKHRSEWYWLLVEGLLAGVVLVALASSGLAVLPHPVAPGLAGSVLGAFALAALGGYYGTRLIDRATRNLLKPEPAGLAPRGTGD